MEDVEQLQLKGDVVVEEQPMQAALRSEIVAALSGPLTIASLTRINRICSAGMGLLEGGGRRGNVMLMPNYVGNGIYDSEGGGMMVGGQGAENFGANIMREAIAAISEWKKPREVEPDAFSLTLAIKNAQDLGMQDAAEKLKDQLRNKLGVGADALPAAEPEPVPAKPDQE